MNTSAGTARKLFLKSETVTKLIISVLPIADGTRQKMAIIKMVLRSKPVRRSNRFQMSYNSCAFDRFQYFLHMLCS